MKILFALGVTLASFTSHATCKQPLLDDPSSEAPFAKADFPKIVRAKGLNARVRTDNSYTLTDGAQIEMDAYGYFSITKAGIEVFNSTPHLFKIKKSSIKVKEAGIPHGLVPAYGGYFLNFQEPMTIDIWQYPIRKRPKKIYVSPLLGYHTEPGRERPRDVSVLAHLNQPVGFTRYYRDSGQYPFRIFGESIFINVGHVAFVAAKDGSVYGMYEILRNFSGRNSWESTIGPEGPNGGIYTSQLVHLVKFDLKNGTAMKIATWEDDHHLPYGLVSYEPVDRPQNFILELSEDEKSVRVYGDNSEKPLIDLQVN